MDHVKTVWEKKLKNANRKWLVRKISNFSLLFDSVGIVEKMILLRKQRNFYQLTQIPQKIVPQFFLESDLAFLCHQSPRSRIEIDEITKIINDHPFPDAPLHPTLEQLIPPFALSTSLVEDILGRLFAAHSNGLKAWEFFRFSLSHCPPSSDAFEKTLHVLTRMRYFDKAWEVLEDISKKYPSLLTLKSMSIMISRIAKFQSYEMTLEAFERLEQKIFRGNKFGTEEFNLLLRAFCTQRQMKEARSVFQKMHSKFSPNTKTMNILLLGFKESGDVTAVELFYHEMVRRGFKPDTVTYNIRIDAYCKRRCLSDALRLLEQMDRVNCLPTLETMTTLIHGAGIARNIYKAKQLFDDLPRRDIQPDVGAYNALMSSLIKCKDIKSALKLMDEMDGKCVGHDNVTYHTMFLGLMRANEFDSICELYFGMIKRNFIPKTRTVVMLMKCFCQSGRLDLGLNLWDYLIRNGFCPHDHALDLLVTGLCSRGRVLEAFTSCKQILERGRLMSEGVFLMLQRFLVQAGELDKLTEIEQMLKRLNTLLPPPKECSVIVPNSANRVLNCSS